MRIHDHCAGSTNASWPLTTHFSNLRAQPCSQTPSTFPLPRTSRSDSRGRSAGSTRPSSSGTMLSRARRDNCSPRLLLQWWYSSSRSRDADSTNPVGRLASFAPGRRWQNHNSVARLLTSWAPRSLCPCACSTTLTSQWSMPQTTYRSRRCSRKEAKLWARGLGNPGLPHDNNTSPFPRSNYHAHPHHCPCNRTAMWQWWPLDTRRLFFGNNVFSSQQTIRGTNE